MTIAFNLISIGTINGAGTHTYIRNLIFGLDCFDIQDCEFIVYKQKHIPADFFPFPSNIKIKWVNVPVLGEGFKRIFFEQTLFYVYLKKCDVIFSHCTSLPLFANCKKVFTLHDVYFKEFPERYSRFKIKFLDWITKQYLRISDNVITVSEYSKSSIIKYYNVYSNNIHVIYNFIQDTKPIDNSIVNILTLEDIDITKCFLFIGSIQPGKNIDGMVKGFIEFSKSNPDYSLLIIGRPTYLGKKIIASIPAISNIRYLGYQPTENVEYLQRNCFATVLVSFCEGFGIPPIEGFRFGKPALVSDKTSLPEVVGKAGKCVNPYDIQSITSGYAEIVKNYTFYQKNIPQQLMKFNKIKSMKNLLDVLGIHYTLK